MEYATNLDVNCVSDRNPWSVTDLSLPNAQLAGVLAGFMVLSITTILARERPSRDRISHTLAFFAGGVVVLALDAYIFGAIAATKGPQPNSAFIKVVDAPVLIIDPANHASPGNDDAITHACKAAWISFMPAAGMLALGAMLLVAGIAWMVTQHAADSPVHNKKLIVLSAGLTAMTMAGAISFLLYDSLIFLGVMQNEFHSADTNIQAHARGFIESFGALFMAVPVLITMDKIFRLTRCVHSKRDWDEVLDPRYRTVEWAAGAAGFYLLVSVAFMWALPAWDHIYIFYWRIRITPRDILWDSIALCLFVPGVLAILLALLLPGPFSRLQRARRCRQDESKASEIRRGGDRPLPPQPVSSLPLPLMLMAWAVIAYVRGRHRRLLRMR
jgi:hypothetical protein